MREGSYLEDEKIFRVGDIIATMGEDTLVNLNTKVSYLVQNLPVDFRDYLDDHGPLPTYWVH